MFTSFYFSNKLIVPYSASITTVRYSGALRCGWRHAQGWCVTVRYGGALRSCVTMVRYAVVTTCVTLVRYGALWWCVTLSATTRVMLIRYDSALHCHATIEMMNSLMHKSFFCLSNEACVIMWVMACGWRCVGDGGTRCVGDTMWTVVYGWQRGWRYVGEDALSYTLELELSSQVGKMNRTHVLAQ